MSCSSKVELAILVARRLGAGISDPRLQEVLDDPACFQALSAAAIDHLLDPSGEFALDALRVFAEHSPEAKAVYWRTWAALQKKSRELFPAPAIEVPQARVFEGDEAAAAWANQHYTTWANSISDEERTALTYFKGAYSKDVNLPLRGIDVKPNGRKIDKALGRKLRKPMDRAFQSHLARVPEAITVWRGMHRNNFGEVLENLSPEELVGLTLTDEGYPATSLLKRVAETSYDRGVQAEILLPAGSNAVSLDVDGFHFHDYKEYEVLLPRKAQFDVLEARQENGTLFLKLLYRGAAKN